MGSNAGRGLTRSRPRAICLRCREFEFESCSGKMSENQSLGKNFCRKVGKNPSKAGQSQSQFCIFASIFNPGLSFFEALTSSHLLILMAKVKLNVLYEAVHLSKLRPYKDPKIESQIFSKIKQIKKSWLWHLQIFMVFFNLSLYIAWLSSLFSHLFLQCVDSTPFWQHKYFWNWMAPLSFAQYM